MVSAGGPVELEGVGSNRSRGTSARLLVLPTGLPSPQPARFERELALRHTCLGAHR
jgi:hypothetical protein